ncbi:hypothetical protein C4D60_Mb10t07690 [Musa balbisiana]|uniref:LOB domain-containing protein n=1 Tax=Musa balbisiana TaxID=52838 RepID=A0A4S8IVI5_MUSBA|nr:hypothetical protein C4D60_Mb10t07690 [Musa balbisiana]
MLDLNSVLALYMYSPGLEASHHHPDSFPRPSSKAMKSSDTTTTITASFQHSSSSSSSSNSSSPTSSPISSSPPSLPPTTPLPPVIHSPCAACKILRRRCAGKCVLAPYFPPTEPLKFTTAHRVFGASNIIKLLQDLPESQRADAVSSMVYEANARIRDPVYGCAGAIFQLQKQVNELQAQLAQAQAELLNLQAQHKNLIALICVEVAQNQQDRAPRSTDALPAGNYLLQNDAYFLDEINQEGSVWDEPLWI